MNNTQAQNKKNNFLAQGGILAAAGLISRLIGMLYRIPMIKIIGEEGMGVYNSAYSIYNIVLIISSYSLPMSVSKLISARRSLKQYKNLRQLFFVSFAFGAVLGMTAAMLMFFGADLMADKLLKMPEAALAIKTLAPTVFIMGMLGVVRGFFQGHGTMIPTALSQILEQILHVAVSLLAGYYLFQKGLALDQPGSNIYASSYGAVGATIGTGVGALSALLFVGFIYLLYRRSLNERCRRDINTASESVATCLKAVAFTSFPILLSAALSNIITILDQAVYGNYIQGDFRQIWGVYTGKYNVLINLPVAIATALSAAAMPAISAAVARKNHREALDKASDALRMILLIALPASFALTLLGRPCFDLLFRGSNNELAGQMMYWGGFAVLFYSLSAVAVGIMQGSGYFWAPILNYVGALLIHFPLLYLCLYIFKMDIQALVLGQALFSLSCFILNTISLKKLLGFHLPEQTQILRLFLGAGLSCLGAFDLYHGLLALGLGNSLSFIICFLLALIIYPLILFGIKALNQQEWLALPKGAALLRLADRLGLIKE